MKTYRAHALTTEISAQTMKIFQTKPNQTKSFSCCLPYQKVSSQVQHVLPAANFFKLMT